jgi:surface polysaccharide O-acyltransferase-like enzyme
MNDYLSRKLKIISFLLIVMVVVLHAHNLKGNSDALNFYVQNLISGGFTKLCVVLFFLISGYLLVVNITEANTATFRRKIKSRVRSVLIPYLLWSFIGIGIFFVLQSLPFTRSFFNSGLIRESSITDLLYTWLLKPLPYQLWFLRHLFVLVLLSPLLYWIVRYTNIFALLLIAVLLLNLVRIPDNQLLSNTSLASFSLGMWFGLHGQQFVLRRYPMMVSWSAIVWTLLVVGRVVFESETWLSIPFWRPLLLTLEYGIGILAIWSGYDFLNRNKVNYSPLPAYLSFAFFLYLAHEPLLTIFKKILLKVLGSGSLGQLLTYFAAPTLVILLCIGAGMLLKRSLPKVYAVLTGGR